MERKSFPTPVGEIWLWQDSNSHPPAGPIVVMLNGAFSKLEGMRGLPPLVPDIPILIGHIPGNHCPETSEQAVQTYCAAYSSVVASLDAPVILAGSSLGATIALGIRAPNVKGILALEPVLNTDEMDFFWPSFRRELKSRPEIGTFLWNVFGLTSDRQERRDYDWILSDLPSPTIAISGNALAPIPSVLSSSDRQRLKQHPRVKLRNAPAAGHNIAVGGANLIIESLRELASPHEPNEHSSGSSGSGGGSIVRGSAAAAERPSSQTHDSSHRSS
jgi:alpha/beta hydrolase family protein